MNNKFLSLIAMTLILSLAFASCKKDEEKEPETPIVENKYDVLYKIDNQASEKPFSNIFGANVTYTDENGTDVVLENVKLPWSVTLTVKKPFIAKMSGKYIVNVANEAIPDTVRYGHNISLSWKNVANTTWHTNSSSGYSSLPKDRFIEAYNTHIASLDFLRTDTIK